jgi:osmotically-inducible protein OsmY
MPTAVVLILLLMAEALGIALIVSPRRVVGKVLSPARKIVLLARDINPTSRLRQRPADAQQGTEAALEPHPEATDPRESDVRAALRGDSRIEHPELIAVSIDRIGTVVLGGAVDSLPQHRAAVHDAREVDGVSQVIADDLKVHAPIGHQRADDQVRAAAMQQLIWDPRIRSTHIHVEVWLGQVTLTGYVGESSERAAAEEDVAHLTGARGVINQIEVR